MGSGVPNRDIRTYDLSGFVSDTWRASSRLTLTLGLRYEYFAPFTEAQGRFVAINPTGIMTTE